MSRTINHDPGQQYLCPGTQSEIPRQVPMKNLQPNSPIPFRLLDLPKEIRLAIYEQLIARTHRNVTMHRTVTPYMIEQGEDQPPAIPMVLVVPDPIPPIHLSCRVVHDEATTLLKELYMAHSVARIIFLRAPRVEMRHYLDCIAEVQWLAEMGWDHCAKITARADWDEVPEDGEAWRGELCTPKTPLKCPDCDPRSSSIPDRIMTFISPRLPHVNRMAARFCTEDATDVVNFAVRCVEKRSYCYPDVHGGELHFAFLETTLADGDIEGILAGAWRNPWGYSPGITLYDAFRSPRETEIQSGNRKNYGGVIDMETWATDWA